MALLCPLQHDTFVMLRIYWLYCTSTLSKNFKLIVSPLLALHESANELATSLLQSRRLSALSPTLEQAEP